MQICRGMNPPRPPRVLSLQSEVVHGHVGNAAARFALQRLGVDVLAVPTVLLSNHPGHGGFRGRVTPAEELNALLDGLEERGFLSGVDAVLSGYLGAPEQAEGVRAAVLRVRRLNRQARYLFDPVFGDDGGAYARPGVAEAMAKQLLPLADIVTPNRFELASLTSRRIETAEDAIAAAQLLGRPLVLATSAPVAGGTGVILVGPASGGYPRIHAPRIDHAVSGTGDLFAALFLGRLLTGAAPPAAMGEAVASVDALIRAAAASGARELPLIEHQDWLIAPPRHPDLVAG